MPQILPALLIERKSVRVVIPAAVIQASIPTFTQSGTGRFVCRATTPQEDSRKGDSLYHACQAALIDHPDDEQIRLGDICFSYIEGFIDGEGPVIKYKFSRVSLIRKWPLPMSITCKSIRIMLNMSKRMGLGCIDIFTFPSTVHLVQMEDGRRTL